MLISKPNSINTTTIPQGGQEEEGENDQDDFLNAPGGLAGIVTPLGVTPSGQGAGLVFLKIGSKTRGP